MTHQWVRFKEAGGKVGWVVLAADDDTLVDLVPDWVGTLSNPDTSRGPFSSLQIGASAALAAKAEGAFVLPLDVPAPNPEVWQALSAALTPETLAAIPTFEQRGGHPVLLSNALLQSIANAAAPARLDEMLRALPQARKARVAVQDARIHANWNTPDDVDPPKSI